MLTEEDLRRARLISHHSTLLSFLFSRRIEEGARSLLIGSWDTLAKVVDQCRLTELLRLRRADQLIIVGELQQEREEAVSFFVLKPRMEQQWEPRLSQEVLGGTPRDIVANCQAYSSRLKVRSSASL